MRKDKGMTLLELVIAISIIAILIALAINQYQKYLYRARSVEAIINLDSIRNLEEVYSAEHGFYILTDRVPDEPPHPWAVEWSDPRGEFATIGFIPEGKVFYRYKVSRYFSNDLKKEFFTGTFDSTLARDGIIDIMIVAAGDLDGDGEINGKIDVNNYSYYGTTDENTKIIGPQYDDF